ncbi:hypothetical protein ACVW00_001430 [Marmoricola sp. URHA0025 HA25]
MARVTEYFNLGATQGSVDFVDVDVEGDVPVYIDPTAIRQQQGEWAARCVHSLQSYFQSLLEAIRNDDEDRLTDLVVPLREPNETHLGSSVGESRGRGLGSQKKADELISSLRGSRAVQSGFLRDLEDSALMVEGIDKDIISDITTCVIRQQLIEYTQGQCEFHEIFMESQESGPMWDVDNLVWVTGYVDLPRAAGDKLLLIPKSLVRVRLSVDKGRYYRGYLRPYFEEEVLANPTAALTRILKDESIKVRKGKLDEKIGTAKPDIIRNTERFPIALEQYKAAVAKGDNGPLAEEAFRDIIGTEVADLREILGEIGAIAPGTPGATAYHRAVAKLFSALFGLSLGNERIEHGIHDGLKRIDIMYDNVARHGFFHWLGLHHRASMVVVECKNYGSDVGNEGFDQIASAVCTRQGQVWNSCVTLI